MLVKPYYKNYLVQQVERSFEKDESLFSRYWRSEIENYCATIGYPQESWYYALSFLQTIDESVLCGQDKNDRANYYLYNSSTSDLYWFANVYDALFFVNEYNNQIQDLSVIGTIDRTRGKEYFIDHSRQNFNGFLWLLPEDIDMINEIQEMPPVIRCLELNKTFVSEEEAAEWLVVGGKAANTKVAIRQLSKCLNGESLRCYGFRWVKE